MIERLPVEFQDIDAFIKSWNKGYYNNKTNYYIARNKPEILDVFDIKTSEVYLSIKEGLLKTDDPFVIHKKFENRVHSIMNLEEVIMLNLEDILENK